MSRWPRAVPSFAGCALFCACLALAGCRGCSSPPPPTRGGPATTQPAGLPVVVVQGVEGVHDFGPVEPGSQHRVVFVVENPSDRAIRFKAVRPDCECISADSQPAGIEPGGSVRITAVYVAPKSNTRYESRLIIPTDDPNRQIISLKVGSGPKEQ